MADLDRRRLKYGMNVLVTYGMNVRHQQLIFMPENKYVRFYITRDLGYLSQSTKDALLKFGRCASCGEKQVVFAECNCGKCREILYTFGDWRKFEELLHKDLRWPINRQAASLRQFRRSLCLGYYENEDIKKIMEIQNFACYFCNVNISPETGIKYEIDHLTSIVNEGSEWPSNMALLCKKCNSLKRADNEPTFWRRLRSINGSDWVAERKQSVPAQRKMKEALTRVRVKELKATVVQFQTAMGSKVDEIAPDLSLWVDVKVDRNNGLVIYLEQFNISVEAFSHRRVKYWLNDDHIQQLAESIVAMARLLKP